MDLKKSLLHGIGWTFIKNSGEKSVSLIVFLILARLLTPEAFGLIAMVLAFIMILDHISDLGFEAAIVQKRGIREAHLSSAFWFNLVVSVLLAVFFYIASPYIAILYNEPELEKISRLLSIVFVLSGLNRIQLSILRRHLKFKEIAIIDLSSSFIAGILGIIFAFVGFGVISLVAYQLTIFSLKLILYWYFSDWIPKLLFSFKHFKELWLFGIQVAIARFFASSKSRIFDYLVGYYFGAAALGYFTIALKIVNAVNGIISNTVWKVLFPVFSSIKEKKESLRNGYLNIITLVIGIVFPVYILIGIYADFLIPIVFGNQWMNTASLLSILVFAGIFQSKSGITRQFLMATGNIKIITYSAITGFIFIILFIFIFREGSLNSIALIYVISYSIVTIMVVLTVIKVLEIKLGSIIKSYLIMTINTFSIFIVYILSIYFDIPDIYSFLYTFLIFVILATTLSLYQFYGNRIVKF